MLRWYEPLVVPGLLQTGEYARAILSARPDGYLDDLDEQVAARLARQAILGRTGAPQLWCILDEGVLHRAIGGREGLGGKWACAAGGRCQSLVLVWMAECVVPVRFRHRGGRYLPVGL